MNRYVVGVFMVIQLGILNAQNNQPRFVGFTTDDGLADNNINDIYQDDEGYLWFATAAGLNRYDGRSFKTYQHERGNTNSLLDDNLIAVTGDALGNIWTISSKGLSKFNKFDGSWRHFLSDKHDTTLLPVPTGFYSRFYLSKTGKMYLFGEQASAEDESLMGWHAVAAFDTTTWDIEYRLSLKELHKRGASGNPCFWEAEDGTIHLGHIRLDFEKQEAISRVYKIGATTFENTQPFLSKQAIEGFQRDGFPEGLMALFTTNATIIDHRGNIWGGGQRGEVFCYDTQNEQLIYYPNWAKDNLNGRYRSTIYDLYFDTVSHQLYLGFYGKGVLIIDVDYELDHLVNKIPDKNGRLLQGDFIRPKQWHPSVMYRDALPDGPIRKIFKDQSGTFWVSIFNKGVYKYAPYRHKFELFTSIPFDSTTIRTNDVQAFHETQSGEIYIGTAQGMQQYFPESNTFKTMDFSINNEGKTIDKISVMDFAEDDTGNVYVGTWGYGTFLYDNTNQRFTSLAFDRNSNRLFDQAGSWVSELHFHPPTQKMLIASWGHDFSVLDLKDQQLYGFFDIFKPRQLLNNDQQVKINIGSAMARHILSDGKDSVWIGNDRDEPLRLVSATDYFYEKRFFADDHPDSLQSTNISVMHYDHRGDLWVGTPKGLSKRISHENRWVTYTSSHGLPSDIVNGLIEDDNGHFWLLTSAGLVHFDPVAVKVLTVYTVRDGLPANYLTKGYRDSEGYCYVASKQGFARFLPQHLPANTFNARPLLSGLDIDRRPTNPDSIAALKALQLAADKSDISFYLSSNDYNNPSVSQFRIKLEGYDLDWNDLGEQNLATYTSLPYGVYQLQAQTTNSDGVWGDPRRLLAFEVEPYWYERLEVRLLFFLALVGVIFVILNWFNRRRINRLKNEQVQQERQHTAEQQLAEAKYNTLVTRLKTHDISNKILAMRYLARDSAGVKYVEGLASRTRKSLSAAHAQSWTLADELECIQQDVLLHNATNYQPVAFSLELSEQIEPSRVELPSLSLQPFVENALKHGLHHLEDREPRLKLGISTFLQKGLQCLCVTIDDNGIGRKKSRQLQQRNKMNNSLTRNWGSFSTPLLIKVWDSFNDGIIPIGESVNYDDLLDDNLMELGTSVTIKFVIKRKNDLGVIETLDKEKFF